MFLLLLKRPTPIRLVSCFALHSYDSIRVARFHVERGPQVAFVVGSHIQLLVKGGVFFYKTRFKYITHKRFCEAADNLCISKYEMLHLCFNFE